MPRPAKGARLYLSPTERVWLIRDGAITRRTGCGEFDRAGAEKGLGDYLSTKFKPAVRENSPVRLPVAEVLTAYGREKAPKTKGDSAVTIGYNIAALMPYWGSKMLSDIREQTCDEYAARRRKTVRDATIRRELSVLSAAIGHWHKAHGPLDAVPVVTMPEKPAARDRWLDRGEAALLLAGALGFYRVLWSDVRTRKLHVKWQRHRPLINRHAARFILVALATGTRHSAVLGVQWLPNTTGGWIDFNRSVMHRRGQGTTETKKRQPPVRLGRKILAHLRRWNRIDAQLREQAATAPVRYLHVVAYDGWPILKLRRAWDSACDLAWLGDDVTPHVLRHTRATWMMQQGIDRWEAAGALGMSVKTLEDVYGHHHPDFQKNAAEV